MTSELKEARDQAKAFLNKNLLEVIDLRRADLGELKGSAARDRIEVIVRKCLSQFDSTFGFSGDDDLVTEIIDEAIGLGPLEGMIRDESVTEIMVNGPDRIFVERKGKIEKLETHFVGAASLRTVIDRIVAPLGRRVDEASPMVDARLPDGSRVNVIIPPLALNGPTVTIRKFSKSPLSVDRLVELDSISTAAVAFLRLCVLERKNILIAGGTGSGKTTLLNALSAFIPADERIVTIEDAAELKLPQEHVVTLEARPANIEGRGDIAIRDLVRNSLRMRPDRIVVGECRGGEALDMLQAMNTGHDGSMTTCHANSPRDSLLRIETMVLMAGFDLPLRAIREQIASALDLIVYQSRMRDGSRRVTHITEVCGTEEGVVLTQDIFHRPFPSSPLNFAGRIPAFASRLSAEDRAIFTQTLKATGAPHVDPR